MEHGGFVIRHIMFHCAWPSIPSLPSFQIVHRQDERERRESFVTIASKG